MRGWSRKNKRRKKGRSGDISISLSVAANFVCEAFRVRVFDVAKVLRLVFGKG